MKLKPIGADQVKALTHVLQEYKSALTKTHNRIKNAENWWKLRNAEEESKFLDLGGGFKSVSSWLHNVIASKHADAMEAYPAPVVLPREEGDKAEATILSSIIPCILEQNAFESTYSDIMWQKCKFGTGAYKIIWDSRKLNGLGDITIESANLLNLFWEAGIRDIQKSKYFFHTEMADKDLLYATYPDLLEGKLKGPSMMQTTYNFDDTIKTDDKALVIDVYYHKNGKLHFIKYVEDIVLFATENETEPYTDESGNVIGKPMAETGLYDHGLYPYVFDALYPVEGSPCGYGYVDIAANPQTEIDIMKTAFIDNTMMGAKPRYFASESCGVNEEEFLDTNQLIIHVKGAMDKDKLFPMEHKSIDGSYLNLLNSTIQELRETSGNTETSTGSVSGGVTAASAIAALQEASGKGSRDSTLGSYRAYGKLIELCIELIRQFYTGPRKFRIVGKTGAERFIQYSNANLVPVAQGEAFGQDLGFTMPVFDIKVAAQKKSRYTTVAQNELALQFYQMGFFNPQNVDQTLACLSLMEFDGKDELMQKISRNGTLLDKLSQYMQMALMLATESHPEMVEGISQDIMATLGGGMPSKSVQSGLTKEEDTRTANARKRSNEASQPKE